MVVHDVIQGSSEWFEVRRGIPSASNFHKIITPTGKESTQADTYMNLLLAELITGKSVNDFEGNEHTDRGNDLEESAAQFYSFQNDVELKKVGFITDSLRIMGCSPDRLIGEDGLLEIKCPAPWTHVSYLLDKQVDQKYYPQIQGQLFITYRSWCDIISYHPEMAPVIVRVERDDEYIKTLGDLLHKFFKKMDQKKAKLHQLGFINQLAGAA